MLGKVDFASAPTFEPLPAGDYDGQTKGWEAKPTRNGDSTNIVAQFIVQYEDAEGNEKTRTITTNWNLKPQSLWRVKRDLIAMGADPSDFEGDDVDLEAILNDLFGSTPTPVTLTLDVREWTPEGETEARQQQEVKKVVGRLA